MGGIALGIKRGHFGAVGIAHQIQALVAQRAADGFHIFHRIAGTHVFECVRAHMPDAAVDKHFAFIHLPALFRCGAGNGGQRGRHAARGIADNIVFTQQLLRGGAFARQRVNPRLPRPAGNKQQRASAVFSPLSGKRQLHFALMGGLLRLVRQRHCQHRTFQAARRRRLFAEPAFKRRRLAALPCHSGNARRSMGAWQCTCCQ